MIREECAKGFFISFDYAAGALTEITRFFKQTGRIIIPLTVREILDEQNHPQAGLMLTLKTKYTAPRTPAGFGEVVGTLLKPGTVEKGRSVSRPR